MDLTLFCHSRLWTICRLFQRAFFSFPNWKQLSSLFFIPHAFSMESNTLKNATRASQLHSHPHFANLMKQRRSGYEPSDTETDWQDSPQRSQIHQNGAFGSHNPPLPGFGLPGNISPMKHRRRHPSGLDDSPPENESAASPRQGRLNNKSPYTTREENGDANVPLPIPPGRRVFNRSPYKARIGDATADNNSLPSPPGRQQSSRSPYKARIDDGKVANSPMSGQRHVSPFLKPESRRQVSPYQTRRDTGRTVSPVSSQKSVMNSNDETLGSSRRKNQRTPRRDERATNSELGEASRGSDRSSYSRRSATAPRARTRGADAENSHAKKELTGERSPSPLSRGLNHKQKESEGSHKKSPSVGELNEMVASIKMSRISMLNAPNFGSTDSISQGDIFFSRDHTALQKNGLPKNDKEIMYPKPTTFPFPHIDSVLLQRNKSTSHVDENPKKISSSFARTMSTAASAAASRVSNGPLSTESSKISDASERSTGSSKRFAANRRKNHAEVWFSCMRRGPCKTSKSPERKHFDEAAFIEKALVVESLRQFWADKHQPGSLSGFTCHKQETEILSQLVSDDTIPHILLKGPSGSGKRSLAMALICEIFGDTSWNMSHDLRYFQVQQQEKRAKQVMVPITSSAHHVELNVHSEPNAKYALMGLVKEISITYAITPEVSNLNPKADFKVIILYGVDKAAESIQHLIKWIMDCYTDTCKLILCCEDDAAILDSVKNRCKVIKVNPPVTHEIMEVLLQIAKKEDFDLPRSFAVKIATKSKQNLRTGIMALEACKLHNYPFVDDQPIPFGWEDVLVEVAAEILEDPSPKLLLSVRGKFQKLLVDFVHPKLILLKLVEQFLKGVEPSSRRELYYWHAYYEKRLPTGSTALLKLEEFVAKFMSMHRKSLGNRQFV